VIGGDDMGIGVNYENGPRQRVDHRIKKIRRMIAPTGSPHVGFRFSDRRVAGANMSPLA
jgi:hypothetical protein